MQRLVASGERRARIVLFVPRWLPEGEPSGLPYRVFPVLSSLARHGFEVDVFFGTQDELGGHAMRSALPGAFAAVAWCAELNPACQVPGLLDFLAFVKESAPDLARIAGGGFFELLPPPRLTLPDLSERIVAESACGALAQLLARMLAGVAEAPGEPVPPARREALDCWALRALDLAPFLRPEAMIFRNQERSLQIPTGYGCAKRCRFCFYERSPVQLLRAEEVVEIVVDLKARYGVRQFLLGELDFLTSRPRALAIARGLLEREAAVAWFALASIQDVLALSDDELGLLYRSGCRVLELGAEVGTDSALRTIGKSFTVEQAVTATDRVRAQGIATICNVLLGFPDETRADRRATLALVERLKRRHGPAVRFNFRLYQPIPNTTMGEEALAHLPPLPRELRDLARYRVEVGRSLPWLAPADERGAKLLVEHFLPLAYDDALSSGPVSPVRGLLRRLARLRCRTGFLGLDLDRALFQRLGRQGLAVTFLP